MVVPGLGRQIPMTEPPRLVLALMLEADETGAGQIIPPFVGSLSGSPAV